MKFDKLAFALLLLSSIAAATCPVCPCGDVVTQFLVNLIPVVFATILFVLFLVIIKFM